jgi:hypothetical protein
VRSHDVAHYQEFARQVLATIPGIRAYTSEIVLEVTKWTTEIPVEEGGKAHTISPSAVQRLTSGATRAVNAVAAGAAWC